MYRPARWLYSRPWVQALSFLFFNSYFLASRFKGFCVPVLNCWACPTANFSCPIGALQNSAGSARLALAGGSSWWTVIPLYVLGTMFFFSALFGRMMCGWLCPFGWFQELLGRRATRRTPRWSWYIRYVVLAVLVIIIPFLTNEAWFSKLCPMGAIQGGIPQPLLNPELRLQIGWLWYTKMAILAATLLWAVFYRRPFCAVICPLGALFSFFSRYSAWRIDYERSKCTDCMWCVNICPQGIDPRKDLNGHGCIGCLECEKCPFDAIHSHPMWDRKCGDNNFCPRVKG